MRRFLALLLTFSLFMGMMPTVYAESEEALPEETVFEEELPAEEEPVSEEEEIPEEEELPAEELPAEETIEEEPAPEEETVPKETIPEETAPEETAAPEEEPEEETPPEVTEEAPEEELLREAALADGLVSSGTCGDNLTWKLDEEGTLTVLGTGPMWNDCQWPEYSAQIKRAEISDGVTSIGSEAFYRCSNLTDVTIPSSVTSIGDNAFRNSGLRSITIPEKVAAIADGAFFGCDSLRTITFEGCPGTISPEAFIDVWATVSFDPGDGWTEANILPYGGELTWQSATSDMIHGNCGQTIVWSLDGEGTMRFSGTGAIRKNDHESTSWYAYRKQIRNLEIGDGITKIAWEVFAWCSNLTEVSLPSSLTELNGAFRDCTGLTSITIPEGVTKIGEYAFESCTNLKEITFNGRPASISNDAFIGVTASVHYYRADGWTLTDRQNYGGTLTWIPEDATPSGACGENLTWELDDDGTLTISGTGEMKNFSYYSYPWYAYKNQIREVTISEGVTSIGDRAFYQYASLGSVQLPESLTKICFEAFSGCSELNDITIPSNLTSIDYGVFDGCESLTNVFISSLEDWLKINSSGWLSNPLLANNDGKNLYLNGVILRELVIPEGVTAIGSYAFYNCRSITGVTIPEGVTAIGIRAFSGCSGLTAVSLPSSLTAIGNFTFYNCFGLTEVTIPEGVTSLGDRAFSGCSRLTAITIPEKVSAILDCSFAECSNLREITFHGCPEEIAETAFNGVTATVFYSPADGWAEAERRNYGGTLTWVEIEGAVASGTCGDNLTWELDDEGTLTISGTGAMTNYLSGNAPWIPYKDEILRLEVAEGVTSIGSMAFYTCRNMTDVTLPSTLTAIESRAFYGCKSLDGITIPESVTQIGGSAFFNCENLSSLVFPDGVTAIEELTFSGCHNLASVTFPANLTSIGDRSFYQCTGLAAAQIPEGVTAISDGAFQRCASMTELTIPSTVTSIGKNAFYDCSSLTEVTIPESVTSLGDYAFFTCSGLTEVTLPSSLTTIGTYVFSGCYNLTSVTIPAAVTGIGNYAFEYCSALQEITFAGHPETISDYAFNDVTAAVHYRPADGWTEAEMLDYGGTLTWTAQETLIASGTCGPNLTWTLNEEGTLEISGTGAMDGHFSGLLYDYTPWNNYVGSIKEVILHEGITHIGSGAFYNCRQLTSITIPEGVVSIGECAFRTCTNLKSITLPSTLRSIDIRAFYNMSIENVYISDLAAWQNIEMHQEFGDPFSSYQDHHLYLNGQLVTDLVIPQGVQAIRPSAFYYCTDITSVTIPESVTVIGERAFQDCSSLTNVTIPNGVETIGLGAFISCSNLNTISIPSSVRSIGVSAFLMCPNLQHVYIDDVAAWLSIEMGDEDANPFNNSYDNKALYLNGELVTGLIIPEGTREIRTSAFGGCRDIIAVTIPESVTSIGKSAFRRTGLKTVTIPGSVTSLGNFAFSDCEQLSKIVFQGSMPEIADWTFGSVSATAYYPEGDSSYSGAGRYGGYLSWIEQKDAFAYGKCGQDLSWELDEEGTLTVYGVGDMQDGCAWWQYSGQIQRAEIAEGVTSIGDSAFYNCTALTAVTIPESVTSIGSNAFYGCSSLASVTIPSGVTAIENGAFNNCTGMTTVTIPEGVTAIGDYAFSCCSSLMSVTIPASVTDIGNFAFQSCLNLKTISFSGHPRNIAFSAFVETYATAFYNPADGWTAADRQTQSTSITWAARNAVIASGTCGTNLTWELDDGGVLTVSGTGRMEEYPEADAPWVPYRDRILRVELEEGVTSVGGTAFVGCKNLLSVEFPGSLSRIGTAAFASCTSLAGAVIPDNVYSIANSAFEGCTSFASVVLPSGLTRIDSYMFYKCGLKSITIPDSVTSIDWGAFNECTSLTAVTIPAGVTSIAQNVFKGCTGLKNVTFEGHPQSIAANAFTGVTADVTCDPADGWTAADMQNYGGALTWQLPREVAASGQCGDSLTWELDNRGVLTVSGTGAMWNGCQWQDCSGQIQRAVISEGVTSIGRDAFYDCFNLTAVTIPSTVTSIGASAFEYCPLQNISISDVAAWLGINFENWASNPLRVSGDGLNLYLNGTLVKDLVIPAGVTEIPEYAFSFSSITGVTIPEGVTRIGRDAFASCGSITGVTIPSTLTYVDDRAFYDCFNLKNIFISDVAAWLGIRFASLSSNPMGTNDNEKALYLNGTLVKNLVIPAGVTALGRCAFASCGSVTAVTISANVTEIGSEAFTGCSNLKNITFNGHPQSIAGNAFIDVTATVSYAPADGWTAAELQNYGGTLTWLERVAAPVISSVANASNGVTVKWNAVPGAAKYRVYQKTGSGSWTKAADTTGTSYTVTGLTAGTTYSFTVRCMNAAGTAFTSSYNTVGKSITYQPAVSNLATPVLTGVTNTSNGVTVKWNAVSGAEKYRVFYKIAGGSWTKAADTTGTSYTVTGLTSGTTYYFTVRCVNAAGTAYTSSFDTVGKSIAYKPVSTTLATPLLTGVSNASNGVTVKWNAVTGAEKYRVFYKIAGGSWTKAADTTGTSYTVTGLTSGTTYYFTVRCVNAAGTAYTSSFDAVGKSIAYKPVSTTLATPVLSSVANAANGVTVKWNAVTGAEKYRVFYKTAGGSWTKAADTTGTSYTVTGLTSGTTYYFTVRCMNAAGTAYTSSFDTVGKSIAYKPVSTTLATPVLSSVANAANGVTVKWNAVSGAEKYRVFYKTAGGSWTKAADTTGTSYTVTGLTSGTTYYFTVRCVNAAGTAYTSSFDTAGKSITYQPAASSTLATPVLTGVTNASNGVTVKWNAVTGAEKYRVFYKTAGGTWTKAADTTGTSYTVTGLTAGTTYTFTVRCVNAAGTAYTSSFDTVGKSIRYGS